MLRLNRRITAQNLGFLALTSAPLWIVSLVLNDSSVGYFSRAMVIPGMAYVALATTLTKALQPYYRHLSSTDRRAGLFDVTVAAAVALPPFFALAALGPQFIDVWLGPGWHESGRLLPPLALGYGVYVVFTVLANACEFLGFLDHVRIAQAAMIPGAIFLLGATIVTRDASWASWVIAGISVPALITLIAALRRSGDVAANLLMASLVAEVLYAAVVALSALVGAVLVSDMGGSAWASFLIGCGCALPPLLVGLRWQPAWHVVRRRGLLPARLVKRNLR
jgi:O-antigen/teichoic acid export membrane protein